jgi:CheY-like chemotaxis protein
MDRTRVLVADDLATLLAAVSALLSDSFDVVSMASDGKAALEQTLKPQPDVVVLDISHAIHERN